MLHHRSLLTILFAALLASPFVGQSTFDPDIGTRIGTGADDEIVAGVALGHAVTFPDGTVTTMIDVDSNGRLLLPSAANVSDPTPTVAELVDGVPSICPLWQDLTPQPTIAAPQPSPISGIYVKSNAVRTTITWVDVKKFESPGAGWFPELFTFQCQLFAGSGDLAFVYDTRVISDLRISGLGTRPAIAGVSVGTPGGIGGGFDPGESDLSAGGVTTTLQTVYEIFDTSAAMCDLRGLGVLLRPNSTGGYDLTVGPAGVTPGGAEKNGLPCPVSIDFFPDGGGGYFAQRTTPSFFDDGGTGIELAAGLGDDANTAPQPLGFTFTWPGGSTSTEVVMDNNGRCMANGTDPGDFSPSVPELLAGPPAIIPFWSDLSSQRGSLRIFTDNTVTPAFAAITWERVPKFAETWPHTFQVILRDDGSFSLNYRDVSLWQTNFGLISDDVLAGCSPGGGAANPGAVDFAALVNVPGEPTIYEFWSAARFNGPNANEPQTPDLHTILTPRSTPTVGGAFEVRMIGVTAATVSINVAIGFTNPNLDLGGFPFGLTGCSLLVNPIVTLPLTRDATDPTIANFRLGITSDPAQAGLPVIMQGINISPTESPNPALPLVTTNAVQGTIRV